MHSGLAARYSVYHASLREFLHGSPGQPGDLLDMSELREAAKAAHRRIADYYLDIFGGLDGASATSMRPRAWPTTMTGTRSGIFPPTWTARPPG